MNFSEVVDTLRSAEGRDAWVAVTSGPGEAARAAVMHGDLRDVDVHEDIAFLPVDIEGEPHLSGNIGVTLDPRDFEGAEGSLPGNLFVRLREYDVRVSTR